MNFELEPWQVFRTESPVNLSTPSHGALQCALKIEDAPKFPDFHGRRVSNCASPAVMTSSTKSAHGDILLHHPYDSYSGVESVHQRRGDR